MKHQHYPSLFGMKLEFGKMRPGKLWHLSAEMVYLGETVWFRDWDGKNPELLMVDAVRWYLQKVKLECGIDQHEAFKVEGTNDLQLPLPF
jgi:hypothetical protein